LPGLLFARGRAGAVARRDAAIFLWRDSAVPGERARHDDPEDIPMKMRTCAAVVLALTAAAPALAQAPAVAPSKPAATDSSSSTMESAKETANKAAETANKAAEDVSRWTRKQWDAARAKWSKEKAKWNSCEQQANARNLTGKANWQFHYDCMTGG